jgi:succinoglycan biosynthesis transport protein ExoP
VSKITRGALLVVAAGRTHKRELAGAISALENVGSVVAGVILTMLPSKGPDSYGYGRYGYGYEYAPEGGASASPTAVPNPISRRRLSPDTSREPETES